MYVTGAWSDLDIITATKTFKVHRSVVCARSPFFHAACVRQMREPGPSTIVMDESQVVVDALLRWFYELPIGWLLERRFHATPETAAWVYARATDAVYLIRAADKYDIEELGALAFRMFVIGISWPAIDPQHNVALGNLFLALVPYGPFARDGQSAIARWTSENLRDIVRTPSAWRKLYGNEEFIKMVAWHSASVDEPRNAARNVGAMEAPSMYEDETPFAAMHGALPEEQSRPISPDAEVMTPNAEEDREDDLEGEVKLATLARVESLKINKTDPEVDAEKLE